MSCDVTMRSVAFPEHVHTCSGEHDADSDHKCSDRECRRWFYSKEV